ncbi:MAG: TIGR04282 family arsenosugar biosynthesis glycosyltransferase [Myxococcales bacterium]|nr:TIGR04282 family arsenosugar biosynthesis glycosyltransferase [Myxococcales bacterium]MDH3484150.1 TIGR04282 family arsenosugar biosynthesis glycosyltransferase [Myxococcales bacterium]
MELAQLAVFVRPPVAGVTKTRLAELLGDRGAAELYEAFVDDTLRLCKRIRSLGRVDVALWCAGAPADRVAEWAIRMGTPVRNQPEGDLGVRLDAAFEEGLARYERVVIIGSDAPTLPAGLIVDAFDSLTDASMVLGPASDGGYYAIGASHRVRPSFEGVRWSTSSTLDDTKKANAGIRVTITSPWYDVDEPGDLQLLRAHLSVAPSAAPATAEHLSRLVALKDRA